MVRKKEQFRVKGKRGGRKGSKVRKGEEEG